jgi:hypothetical protein
VLNLKRSVSCCYGQASKNFSSLYISLEANFVMGVDMTLLLTEVLALSSPLSRGD